MLIDNNPADNFYHRIVIEDSQIASNVIEFESSELALNFLKEPTQTIDLVFLDINMPGVDGFEFLDILDPVENMEWGGAVLVVLTNSLRGADMERAMRNGKASAYLSKPLTEQHLWSIVREHFSI